MTTERNPFEKLAQRAQQAGWRAALFDYMKDYATGNASFVEDIRSTDWKYLLPAEAVDQALVIGAGLGMVPLELAKISRRVYVADTMQENLAFLSSRICQEGIDNIVAVRTRMDAELPFAPGSFDLIAIRDFLIESTRPRPFSKWLSEARGLLRVSGILCVSIANRLAPRRFQGGNGSSAFTLHSFFGYRRILQEQGWLDVRFYLPLPFREGVPLFIIPLNENAGVEFFVSNLFVMFDMVSPEMKRLYRFEYGVGRALLPFVRLVGPGIFSRLFAPGFIVIARRSAQT